ncbi:MAG: hypothetical protein ACXW5U_26080 [Thermoanaerobaculia bacterium]
MILAAILAAAVSAPTVTLDVKDAEPRVVLKAMQKQCGIRNLIIDPDVPKTAATFYFREVPCETAFRVVLRTYGLAAQSSPQVLEVLR